MGRKPWREELKADLGGGWQASLCLFARCAGREVGSLPANPGCQGKDWKAVGLECTGPSSSYSQSFQNPAAPLCTPSPWPFRKTFRPNSHSAPTPRPTKFQPPESSPGVLPPTTALTELLLGGRRALETGGTHRAGTGRTLAQPMRGWEGKRDNKGHRGGEEPGPRYTVWGVIQGHLPGHTSPCWSSI